MKCLLFLVVSVTTTLLSLATAFPDNKRDVDLTDIVREIQDVIDDLHDGVLTSELSPRVSHIIEQAKAIDCGADVPVEQSHIDEVIDRVISAITSHTKKGKLETDAVELNRAFYLWDGLADYLDTLNASGDQERLCEAVTAVWGSGQTILDTIKGLGETIITFTFDNVENSEPGKSKRRVCIGIGFGRFCAGIGWGKRAASTL